MPYVRQRWQKPEATPRTRHGTRARGALASASSTAFYCETTSDNVVYPRPGRAAAPARDYVEFRRCDDARSHAAPTRWSPAPRRRALCGSAARAGRPLHTPPHARSPHGGPGAGTEPGTLRGYHRQARGAAHPRWVSRPRSSSPGASIAVIPGVGTYPPRAPCPGHHISHSHLRASAAGAPR